MVGVAPARWVAIPEPVLRGGDGPLRTRVRFSLAWVENIAVSFGPVSRAARGVYRDRRRWVVDERRALGGRVVAPGLVDPIARIVARDRPKRVVRLAGAVAAADTSRRAAGRRLGPFLPWAGAGRWWPAWRRLPRAAPFLLGYLAISWALFLPMARPASGNVVIDVDRVRPLLFAIPDLGANPPRALVSLLTAPWLNHNLVQLVYVTALLGLFGLPFEAREGSFRTAALFFGTTFAGALCAGVLLQALYPEWWDGPLAARAWERIWSGGSAGAFGLMGALAARARLPWPLLALFVLWEANVVFWYLREYTPAFHLSALLVGFLVARVALPPRRETAPGRPGGGVE